jgi:biotin transport system substrate-specific component
VLPGVALGPGSGQPAVGVRRGLLGLLVFASGAARYVLTPTFGFLVGFVAAALVVGLVAGDPTRSGTPRVALGLVLGILTIYLVGVPWFGWNLAVYQRKDVPTAVLWKFAAVYLPLDVLKAALVLPVIRVIRSRGGLLAAR